MIPSDKFCLRLGDFQENIKGIFKDLQKEKEFCDVTLVCEDNQQFEAHKVILSASSSLLRDLLKSTNHSHPLLYMWGVKTRDLANVVDFIYNGQVEIYQSDLNEFLLVARQFQLIGINEFSHSEELNETKPSNAVIEDDTDTLHELNKQEIEDTEEETIEVENIENVKPKHVFPSKRKNTIWNYFFQDTNDATSVNCKIVNCGRMFGRGNRYMINHIERIHPIQFEEYVANKVELNKSINELNHSEELNETKPSNYALEADSDTLHELNQQEIEDPEQENIEDEKPKFAKRSRIWTYFSHIKNDKTSVHCNIGNCERNISRGKGGNLNNKQNNGGMINHLKRSHPIQFEEYVANKVELNKRDEKPKYWKNRISTIWKYFSQNKNDKTSVHCKIGNCGKNISRGRGRTAGNGRMINHIERFHQTEFEEYVANKGEFKKGNNKSDSTFVHTNIDPDLVVDVGIIESLELEQTNNKSSIIWNYFDEDQDDQSIAVCQVRSAIKEMITHGNIQFLLTETICR